MRAVQRDLPTDAPTNGARLHPEGGWTMSAVSRRTWLGLAGALAAVGPAAAVPDRFDLVIVDDGPERYQGHEIDYDRFVGRFVDFLDQQRS